MATSPLQGFDVTVSIVTAAGGSKLAGEFQELTLNINNDLEEYLTLNSRMPYYLDGELKLDGSLKRGFIDIGSLLADVFGASELKPDSSFSSVRFVITATFKSTAKGLDGRYKLTGCIIDKVGLSAAKGKAVVNSDYSFKAETIEEATS